MKLESDIKLLREKFIKNFCKKKGWNLNELSANKMLIITQQKDYPTKKPLKKRP
jgi:hypothetical protein